MRFKKVLVINKNYGILGSSDDHNCENQDDRLIDIDLEVPDNFFDPLQVEIQVPKSLMPEVITGEVNSVEYPISSTTKQSLNEKIVISELTEGNGFIAWLKRTILNNK